MEITLDREKPYDEIVYGRDGQIRNIDRCLQADATSGVVMQRPMLKHAGVFFVGNRGDLLF